jgi:hypothetical protein
VQRRRACAPRIAAGRPQQQLLGAEISSSERMAIDAGAVAMVQAAEYRCSVYGEARRRLRWREPFLTGGRLQAETAVRPPVVVMRVLAQQSLSLAVVPDEQVIEAVASKRADEALAVRERSSRIPRPLTRPRNVVPYTLSRSCKRKRGGTRSRTASTTRWAVHSAVGCAVTPTCMICRRSSARTTKP